MLSTKRKKLERSGWKFGSVAEFLGSSPDQIAYVEIKLALRNSLRKQRLNKNMSQIELAKIVESSQSRIAKMEAGDPSISIDLLMKSLLVLGASRKNWQSYINGFACVMTIRQLRAIRKRWRVPVIS